MVLEFEDWLRHKQEGKWGALEEHTHALKNLIQYGKPINEVAKELLEDVIARPVASASTWRLLNLVFDAAAELPEYTDTLVLLVFAIRGLPPSPQKVNRITANLWHDALWSRKSLHEHTKVHQDGPDGWEKWVNFVAFSARLVRDGDEGFSKECGVFCFFDTRDILETQLGSDGHSAPPNSFAKDGPISYNAEAVAQWIVVAGPRLHGLSNDFFGEGWQRGFAKRTDLWDGEPGFSSGRWNLWRSQLELRIRQGWLSERAEEVARQAIKVINGFS